MSVEAKTQRLRKQIAAQNLNIEKYKEEILDLRDRYRKLWKNWDSALEAISQAEKSLATLTEREGDPEVDWTTLRKGIDNG